MFEKEYEFYKKNKEELVKKYTNKYIIIKDDKILGAYGDIESAMNETLKEHKAGTFLLKQAIAGDDTVIFRSRVGYAH